MLDLALKWMMIALGALALFSALTALFMFFELNFGACRAGGEGCFQKVAVLYTAGIGIVGFSVSAFAAFMIRRNLSRD